MKKSELIEKIAENMSVDKNEVSAQLEETLRIISEELSRGEDIVISGFGTFKIKHREARQGRNPSTGEPLVIQASKAVSFKAAKVLKEKVN